MEFSFRISEDDYVNAYKLIRKKARSNFWKTVIFWAFVTCCLVLLFSVIGKVNQKRSQQSVDAEPISETAAPRADVGHALVVQLGPFAVVVVVIVGVFVFWVPYTVRRKYRKDPNCQGAITVRAEADSVAIDSSVGSTSVLKWSVFKDWVESETIVLLRYPSGLAQILSLRDLDEARKQEFREILTAALPKK